MSLVPASSIARPVPAPLLQAERLSFAYPGVLLFDGLSASIGPGLTLVRGGDGRGKSTLLRLFAGELVPQAGRILVDGVDIAADPGAGRRRVFRPDLDGAAFEQATPAELLDAVRAQWPAFDQAAYERFLGGLSLLPHLGKKLFMLSTGSRRKLCLAAAFAAGAPVTLLDDPFGALDRPSVRFVEQLLREAATSTSRAVVFTAYEVPPGLPLAGVIDLGD